MINELTKKANQSQMRYVNSSKDIQNCGKNVLFPVCTQIVHNVYYMHYDCANQTIT